jgi:hypothetical protein
MGWRGVVRAIEADARRNARARERNKKIEAKMRLLNDAVDTVNAFESYVEELKAIHTTRTSSIVHWNDVVNEPAPNEPTRRADNELKAKTKLDNFKPSFLDKLFGLTDKKCQKIKASVGAAIVQDEAIFQVEKKNYQEILTAWHKKRGLAHRVLIKDAKSYIDALQELHPFENIQRIGSEIKFSVDEMANLTATLKVCSEDVVPNEKYTLRQSGTLSSKEMPKAEFYSLYQDYVCSCILRIAAEIFAILPVEKVLINANDDLLNSSNGHVEEQTICSVLVMRKTFEGLNLSQIDTSDSLKLFLHRMQFKKSSGFLPVKAVDFEELTVGTA